MLNVQGFLGECGLRGGYFELLGFSDEVQQQVLKLASISLCSNTIGQLAVGCMVNPPYEGDPSFNVFAAEKASIMDSLRRRAVMMTEALNKLEGISCNAIDGALYAFPTIVIPG